MCKTTMRIELPGRNRRKRPRSGKAASKRTWRVLVRREDKKQLIARDGEPDCSWQWPQTEWDEFGEK